MESYTHNRFFKRPHAFQQRPERSPSPPWRYVEPISPCKPTPIEPRYINYPPINDQVSYAVRPETAYVATPRPRQDSNASKRGHHRTPSTIDALAEAALAASPSFIAPFNGASAYRHIHAPPLPSAQSGSEPPHKRARSEVLSSTLVAQFASRPATSYAGTNGWYNSHTPPSHVGASYDSRVEEAALLLNFRTGGFSTTLPVSVSHSHSIPLAPNTARPHANSFPQYAHGRAVDLPAHALLPPFIPQQVGPSSPALPSPEQTVHDPGSSPKAAEKALDGKNSDEAASEDQIDALTKTMPQQTQTPPDESDSRAPSADVTMSEASEAAPKSKRGWPRGKPRNGRKSLTEKATKGRAAHRKTLDVSKSSTSVENGSASDTAGDDHVSSNRRKSFSGITNDTCFMAEKQDARARSVPPETPMIIRPASPSKTKRKPRPANVETVVCAGCATVRETANSHGELDEWVSCNGCKNWFHVDCAGFKNALEVRDVDKYFCSACEHQHGKTTYVRKSSRAHASVDYAELQRGVLKTSEESTEHHYLQAIKDGSIYQFDKENFPRLPPELVTREVLERSNSFVEPICIPAAFNPRPWLHKRKHKAETELSNLSNAEEAVPDSMAEEFEYEAATDEGQDKLDMVMPEDLTVRQVCNLVGAHTPLEVIDVKTQNLHGKWDLKRWADFYDDQGEDKPIRNVISLEVSDTKLGRMLRRPKVVRDMDLQDEVWPQEETDKGKYPKVQFYCLMSVADSYTDFHIDFGGSSVYYHILRGQKTFFFIPPKPKYLKMYEEWNGSPQQSHTFLPHKTGECYRVDLSEGDTMLIPSGWIHAVWTPATSLVVGGNFLTRMSFKNQFKVYDIEQVNKTPLKFQYPFFRRLMWYTAIRYLKDDPLPAAVAQAFSEGQKYERQVPLWADFDGKVEANDPRPGAKNARFYSQAELNGLPDLVQFIFRQVMIVMGKVDGHSQDYIKRTNAIIPKGHGEPLEIAKTFALWVAWKRGNEAPPGWAWEHPDAILPSKEERPPKQLSARALKEMERKEAIAAWRVAPDRQSSRIKSTGTAAGATADGAVATPEHALHHQSSLEQKPTNPSYSPVASHSPSLSGPPPMTMMMNGMPGQHLSTPKTSVLGPKRVACDNCRKRRIKCKHKDLVTEVTPSQLPPSHPPDELHHSQPDADFFDNITVTPPKPGQSMGYVNVNYEHGGSNPSPYPGTNAYVTANIPMAMNGVPMFGDAPKRGRSKACYECRRSKRRCVHDENGQVDPVKAAETPVPRGSLASKKRPSEEDTPSQPSKRVKAEGDMEAHPPALDFSSDTSGSNGVSQPHVNGASPHQHFHASSTAAAHHTRSDPSHPSQRPQLYHESAHSQPQIDPSLFMLYPEPSGNSGYPNGSYPYPGHGHPNAYQLPSLEQIASEVLDMNGHSHEDHQDNIYQPQGQHDPTQNVHVYSSHDGTLAPNGTGAEHGAHPDESVDSAVSLPPVGDADKKAPLSPSVVRSRLNEFLQQNHSQSNGQQEQYLASTNHTSDQGDSTVRPSVEAALEQEQPVTEPVPVPDIERTAASHLPLYKPPAPPSASPEQSRRQPYTNGVRGTSPRTNGDGTGKHKLDSSPEAPRSAKKAKLINGDHGTKDAPEFGTTEERESLELAKLLQKDDLGLRKRGR